MSTKAVFDQLVTAATRELFAARGIAVQSTVGSDAAVEYAATIGFSSDVMRGMIGIGMDPETLQRLVAKDRHALPGCNVEDWLGESANQLLGRLKNKFLGYGVVLSVALPTVLQGVRLQFLGTGATALWTYAQQSEAGLFWVWLDVRSERELTFTAQDHPDQPGPPEGELVLF